MKLLLVILLYYLWAVLTFCLNHIHIWVVVILIVLNLSFRFDSCFSLFFFFYFILFFLRPIIFRILFYGSDISFTLYRINHVTASDCCKLDQITTTRRKKGKEKTGEKWKHFSVQCSVYHDSCEYLWLIVSIGHQAFGLILSAINMFHISQ